jgi:hypothetical protein
MRIVFLVRATTGELKGTHIEPNQEESHESRSRSYSKQPVAVKCPRLLYQSQC